ncbi:MAG: peptidase, partial [Gemmataceae bacterium]
MCSLCLCGSFSSAASPILSGISPPGAQRGTEAVVTFGGGRLADAQEVLVYYPGITVKKLEVVNDAQLKVTFAIAPDCRLGEHLFRIRTATGVSDARTFWVGALPVVDEKEPNSEFATPQPIPLNSTVHGSIGGEDVDYFVVDMKKGQRLSVEVEAMRLGVTFWDPFVAILNDKRFELATSDDSPLGGQDGRCSVIVPADGKYLVMVREASNGGGSSYRLHVGTFPVPTAVIPAGGKPGEEVEFTFLGDPAGPLKQKIKLPATADDHFRLHCQTPDGIAP